MATYTTRIGLEKQGDGENPNSWGDILNQNVIDLLDTAIAGYEIVSVSSVAVSLTSNNGAPDTARSFGLRFEGTLTTDVTVTIPQKEKIYFVYNNTSGPFKVFVQTAGGPIVTVADTGSGIMMACDGVGIDKIGEISSSVSSFTVNKLNIVSVVSGKDAHFDGVVSVSSFSAVDINATAISLVSASTSVLSATSISTSVMYAKHIDAVSVSVSVLTATTINVTNLSGILVAGTPLTLNPYANSTTITQAHGLGAQPIMCDMLLECLSPDLNYSAGDKISLSNSLIGDGNGNRAVELLLSSTNVVLITGSASLQILNKTSYGYADITPSKWKITITPYKLI